MTKLRASRQFSRENSNTRQGGKREAGRPLDGRGRPLSVLSRVQSRTLHAQHTIRSAFVSRAHIRDARCAPRAPRARRRSAACASALGTRRRHTHRAAAALHTRTHAAAAPVVQYQDAAAGTDSFPGRPEGKGRGGGEASDKDPPASPSRHLPWPHRLNQFARSGTKASHSTRLYHERATHAPRATWTCARAPRTRAPCGPCRRHSALAAHCSPLHARRSVNALPGARRAQSQRQHTSRQRTARATSAAAATRPPCRTAPAFLRGVSDIVSREWPRGPSKSRSEPLPPCRTLRVRLGAMHMPMAMGLRRAAPPGTNTAPLLQAARSKGDAHRTRTDSRCGNERRGLAARLSRPRAPKRKGTGNDLRQKGPRQARRPAHQQQ